MRSTISTITTTNLDLIQQAVDDAEKQLQGKPLAAYDFENIRHEYEARLDQSTSDILWLSESIRRLIATVSTLEDKINELKSELSNKNRIIFQIKKAIE